jgi:hypothetical protein
MSGDGRGSGYFDFQNDFSPVRYILARKPLSHYNRADIDGLPRYLDELVCRNANRCGVSIELKLRFLRGHKDEGIVAKRWG